MPPIGTGTALLIVAVLLSVAVAAAMTARKPRRAGWRVPLWTFAGGLIGGHLAMLAGGFQAAVYGQPFSGRTGWDVFPAGMIFPGAYVFGPPLVAVGAAVGGIIGIWRSRRR